MIYQKTICKLPKASRIVQLLDNIGKDFLLSIERRLLKATNFNIIGL